MDCLEKRVVEEVLQVDAVVLVVVLENEPVGGVNLRLVRHDRRDEGLEVRFGDWRPRELSQLLDGFLLRSGQVLGHGSRDIL